MRLRKGGVTVALFPGNIGGHPSLDLAWIEVARHLSMGGVKSTVLQASGRRITRQ